MDHGVMTAPLRKQEPCQLSLKRIDVTVGTIKDALQIISHIRTTTTRRRKRRRRRTNDGVVVESRILIDWHSQNFITSAKALKKAFVHDDNSLLWRNALLVLKIMERQEVEPDLDTLRLLLTILLINNEHEVALQWYNDSRFASLKVKAASSGSSSFRKHWSRILLHLHLGGPGRGRGRGGGGGRVNRILGNKPDDALKYVLRSQHDGMMAEGLMIDLIEATSFEDSKSALSLWKNARNTNALPAYFGFKSQVWSVDLIDFPKPTAIIALTHWCEDVLLPGLDAWLDGLSAAPVAVIIHPGERKDRKDFIVRYLEQLKAPLQETGTRISSVSLLPSASVLRDWAHCRPWRDLTQKFLNEESSKDPALKSEWLRTKLLRDR